MAAESPNPNGESTRNGSLHQSAPPRNLVITTLAVFNLALGTLIVLVCGIRFIGFTLGYWNFAADRSNPGAPFAAMVMIVYLVINALVIVFGLTVIAAGRGLLRRLLWARNYSMVLGGISAILALVVLIQLPKIDTSSKAPTHKIVDGERIPLEVPDRKTSVVRILAPYIAIVLTAAPLLAYSWLAAVLLKKRNAVEFVRR